jgi:hypothetical protein
MADKVEAVGNGALFKNLKKATDEGKPSWPDYVGDITINGTKYRLASWLKDGAKGKYLSLSARPFEDAEAKPKAAAPAKGAGGFARPLNDEIPFAPEWRG